MSDTALRPARFRFAAVLPGWLGLAVVTFWIVVALFAPLIAPHPAGAILRVGTLAPASAAAPFGTDFLGRDMLSRVIYGARYTVGLALLAAVCASGIGAVLGILAAVRGGWTDGVLSRSADALISIPHLMFALVLVAARRSRSAVCASRLVRRRARRRLSQPRHLPRLRRRHDRAGAATLLHP